jgi:hypothetical protein
MYANVSYLIERKHRLPSQKKTRIFWLTKPKRNPTYYFIKIGKESKNTVSRRIFKKYLGIPTRRTLCKKRYVKGKIYVSNFIIKVGFNKKIYKHICMRKQLPQTTLTIVTCSVIQTQLVTSDSKKRKFQNLFC